MNRREFIKKGFSGIVIGIPFISGKSKDQTGLKIKGCIAKKTEKGVMFSLKLNKSDFEPGEMINITYSLYNTKNYNVHIWHSDRRRFNFSILRGNRIIFSHPKIWHPVLSALTLEKKEEVNFHRTWSQRNNADGSVPSGEYTLTAGLCDCRFGESVRDLTDSTLSVDFKIL